ncbi:MAG: acyltransferase [Flavobacterium sp.]|nr:acyltransferase [Flavobacterium sp.]
MSKVLHLRGLNGLRAIAAIAVVISHITLDLSSFGLIDTIVGADANGNAKGLLLASYGVSIFFALSGFLITYLLLLEKEKTSINIKHFYIRRILRIWPLYYLYIIICLIVYYLFQINFEYSIVPFYILLAANIPIIINNMLPFLGHFWSIGVEEQFYLFWPWLARIDNKRLLRSSFGLVLFLIILKLFFWFINYKWHYSLPLTVLSVSRFHIMIIGAIGAILYYNKSVVIKYCLNIKTQIFCWLIMILLALNLFHISSLIDNEILGIVTVMIILAQITRTNYIVNLDNKLFDFIGKISYGIYVIHPLIIFLSPMILGKFKDSSFVNYIYVYGFILLSTITISYISYMFYEKKFIKLKGNFAKIKSAS